MPATTPSTEDQHVLEYFGESAQQMNLKTVYVTVPSRLQPFCSFAFRITNIILIHIMPVQVKLHLKYIHLALFFVGNIVYS